MKFKFLAAICLSGILLANCNDAGKGETKTDTTTLQIDTTSHTMPGSQDNQLPDGSSSREADTSSHKDTSGDHQ